MAMTRFGTDPRSRWRSALLAAALLALLVLVPAATAGRGPDITGIGQQTPAAPPKSLTPEMTLNRWSIGDLQLSPDGRRVAMVISEPAKPSGPRRNIWIYDLAGRRLEQFTASPKSDTRPRWSPDGRTLAFLSNREGTSQIYLISPDGGEARSLTESKTGIDSLDW
jgi:Tol biopolymer transport system component